MKYIYYNMLIWLLASCSFLEEYSQDTVYVRGYQDLEELLVGEGYMSAYAANSLDIILIFIICRMKPRSVAVIL